MISFSSELTHWASKNIHFRVLPKYKSKGIGDEVLFDDEVLFESFQEGYFMDFAMDLPHFLNDSEAPKSAKEENRFRTEVAVFDSRYRRFKTVFGTINHPSWRILAFRGDKEKKGEISGLDLVRFNHSEYDGMLTAALRYKCSAPEVYLRTFNGMYESEKTTLSSIWQVNEENAVYIGNSLKMASKVLRDGDEDSQGQEETDGYVESKSVKIQHFLSQKFLFSIPYKDSYICVLSNHSRKPLRTDYLSIKLEPLLSNLDRVADKKTYILKTLNSSCGLHRPGSQDRPQSGAHEEVHHQVQRDRVRVELHPTRRRRRRRKQQALHSLRRRRKREHLQDREGLRSREARTALRTVHTASLRVHLENLRAERQEETQTLALQKDRQDAQEDLLLRLRHPV